MKKDLIARIETLENENKTLKAKINRYEEMALDLIQRTEAVLYHVESDEEKVNKTTEQRVLDMLTAPKIKI